VSELASRIRKSQQENKSEFLKLKAGETVVVKLDLNENGEVVAHEYVREYEGKKSKSFRFPVTIVNTGERRMLGLSLSWALNLVDLVDRKQMNVIEVTRNGDGTKTTYNFAAVGKA
jgi:hypothetical protein